MVAAQVSAALLGLIAFAPTFGSHPGAARARIHVAAVVVAHPLHTSLTEVAFESSALTLQVRTFAQDLDSVLAATDGPRASASDAAVVRYITRRLSLTGDAGAPIRLESCGVRRLGDAVITCLHSRSRPTGGVTMRNELLFDLFADQINIVQITRLRARRSLIFTSASKQKALG